MGDGPGYDYLADRTALAKARKRKAQLKRIELLYAMLHSVGFGDTDGDNTRLEAEVAAAFQRNLDLLNLITRE